MHHKSVLTLIYSFRYSLITITLIMEFHNNSRPNSNAGRNGNGGASSGPSKRKRSESSKQCFAFKKSGTCEKGSDCKFKHGSGDERGGQKRQQQQQQQQQGGNQSARKQQPPQQQQQQSHEPRLVASSARDDVKEGAPDMMEVVQETGGGKAYMTQALFSSLPISPLVKRALADVMKYTNLTQVGKGKVVQGERQTHRGRD